MRTKTMQFCGLFIVTLLACSCHTFALDPRAGAFLRQSDAEAVFGTPMRVLYDSRDKHHPNVSSCAYSGKGTDGNPVSLKLHLAYCDAAALASAETAWRYGKDFPVEPPGLNVLPGIGESAWIVSRYSGQTLFVRLSTCYFVLVAEGPSVDTQQHRTDALIELSRSIASDLARREGL